MDIDTHNCAVVPQKAQVDLAVKVDGRKIGERENLEGELSHSGIAILKQLNSIIR